MKHIITLFFLLIILNVSAQGKGYKKYDKKVFMYENFTDFKNDKGKYIGEYGGARHSPNFSEFPEIKKISITNNLKESEYIKIFKYWGFKIDNFIFRPKKSRPKMPVVIVKIKEKVFYLNGDLYLNMIQMSLTRGESSIGGVGVFYSDNLESEILPIKAFSKKEKNNQKFSELTKCFKKAKKRYGSQAKFNAYSECIDKF